MTITESKLDDLFTIIPFFIESCGILLYVRNDLACRELKRDELPNNLEGIVIELNLRKLEWLLFQHIIFLLNLMRKISLMFLNILNKNSQNFSHVLKLSVPHMINSC